VGGRATRALVPGLLVLALVALVAVASTGSAPSASTGETRRPSDVLLDIFFSFVLVAFIPAAAILVWGLMQRRAIAEGFASGRFGRRTGLVTFLLVAAALGLFGYWRLRDPQFRLSEQFEDVIVPRGGTPTSSGEDEPQQYEAEFAWIPVLVVVLLGAVVFAAHYASARRRRRRWDEREATAEALAEVLDDTLDDLRAEIDPRKAVIAAYARLERTLAAHGSARKAAETPEEYLARILPRLAIERRSIRRLTDLFTRAKFSQHDVDAGMKEEAIDALAQVRDELRAAAAAAADEPPTPSPLRTREERA
jgi:Domain of unknown function (DUF4129)